MLTITPSLDANVYASLMCWSCYTSTSLISADCSTIERLCINLNMVVWNQLVFANSHENVFKNSDTQCFPYNDAEIDPASKQHKGTTDRMREATRGASSTGPAT